MAGNMAAANCAIYHRDSDRQASANYYIGSDGMIVSGVPEEYRAWTSSSAWNDHQSITMEVANISNDTGEISPEAYASTVKLCADVCVRYGIDPHYDGTVNGTITYHSMFASTSCPGPWLTQKIISGQFERDIKAAMKPAADPKPDPKPVPKPKPKIESKTRAVYRLYNPNSGDHLYTTNVVEAKACQGAGMEYEGIAWIYPETGDGIYRLVHNGRHHLALKDEHDKLVAMGWKSEGLIARSGGEGRPIRRLYNPNGGEHVFTTSDKEHDALTQAGWKCELAPFTY